MAKASSKEPKRPVARAPRQAAKPAPTEAAIRARAYELFVARGALPGREVEDWLQAERELRGDA